MSRIYANDYLALKENNKKYNEFFNMTLLGYTKTAKFNDLSIEELQAEAKEMVIRDFTDKMCFYYINSGNMIPYSLILYQIFENRYGFDDGTLLYTVINSRVIDGLKIETDEILERVSNQLSQGCGMEFDKNDIHKWFGIGEFPFLNTKIYRYNGYDIITYYISR